MRYFLVAPDRLSELRDLPATLPDAGFLWIGSSRREFEQRLPQLQTLIAAWTGAQLVDLHVSDLLNPQLPSQHDCTSWYDLVVFRRLTTHPHAVPAAVGERAGAAAFARDVQQMIDTSAVGFAVFDRLLLTVHPEDCAVREHMALRLAEQQAPAEGRGHSRLPSTSADLMLRMIHHMVDSYLDLRRLLTHQLGTLQKDLLDPKSRFADWEVLLESRDGLHLLEDICEDQRSAIQEWIDALDERPEEAERERQRERELLRVRSRDVLEHVERVLAHVRRLEQASEVAVQMHFSAIGNRTNDIMRTLTVLTAVFLPLNLITGFFGMNFEGLPLIHSSTGVWIAAAMMAIIAVALGGFFWNRRYLGSSRRR